MSKQYVTRRACASCDKTLGYTMGPVKGGITHGTCMEHLNDLDAPLEIVAEIKRRHTIGAIRCVIKIVLFMMAIGGITWWISYCMSFVHSTMAL